MKFGEFRLDLEARQLHRGREERHLSPKAFDLLATLVAHRPGVVDKDALRDRLWPGTNVVDANLNNLASEIRSALDDDPQQPRFVRTVHRVGYAFCGEVSDEAASDGTPRMWLVWNDRTMAIDASSMTVGRDPACQIRIDAPGVSRRHALIRVSDEAGANAKAKADVPAPTVVLEDLGSTNGTFVGGRRVRKPVTLEGGESIRIGEATLIVRVSSPVDAPTKKIKRPR